MTVITRAISDWTVEASGRHVPAIVRQAGALPATVPGAVHTDLLAAGLIADPYLDENEKLQSWIGLTDWTYRGSFDWAPDGGALQRLVFGGIDTIARVRVNGHDLGSTRNMHRTHRFDITSALNEGANEIEVAIASPVREADATSLNLGYRPHTNHHPYNAIRKMACSFGWDWGLDTSTSALWKPVVLESWSGPRFDELRVGGDVVAGVPTLRVHAAVSAGNHAGGLQVRVRVGDLVDQAIPIVSGAASADIAVPDAGLWWPRGYGAATLHDAGITLMADDQVFDTRSHRVGFRLVELRTEPDEHGIGFAIVVNGAVIRVRGANWIPDDAFLHRVDRARYARRLDQAEFAGINLIRVWGGGIYESDDLFAECDERGILTWQDFLLACAAYSEDEPLWSEFEAEAREAITRLGAHPSLVVLNGNNENIWGQQDWNWDKRLDGRTWGAGYYYDLFPQLVGELAPHVGYTPGSPFSPDPASWQNEPSTGTVHIWDLWNQRDWPEYRDYRPRFVAEFGWQGPPTWTTLTRAVSDDPLTPESPGMLVHQKAAKGNDKLTDGLTAHFPLPNDMADWHWAMSLNQAIAVRTAIEWWRSLPECTGTIVWQFNDCWPVTSWAAVDGDERPKPLLYALRQAHADRLLTIQPDGDGLVAVLVNDTDEEWVGTLWLERRTYDGDDLDHIEIGLAVPRRGVARVEVPLAIASAHNSASECVIARVGTTRAVWFFTEYRDSELGPADYQVTARQDGADQVITITAHTLLRDVTVLADRVAPDAVADRALDTLFPGETIEIRIVRGGAIGLDELCSRGHIRSANDLVVPRRSSTA